MVIVALAGVSHQYDKIIPDTIPKNPMTIPIKITEVKFLPNFIAILAGKTIIVETSRAPAAGMVKAMAIPVTILNKIDIRRTGSPSTKAVSSSKVRIYIGLINKSVRTNIIKAITKSAMTCSRLIVIIDPNKYCSRLTLPALSDLLIIIKETAKPKDIKIAVDISI